MFFLYAVYLFLFIFPFCFYLSIYLSIYLYLYLFIYQPIYLVLSFFIYILIPVSICLFICLSIRLWLSFICLFVYLFIVSIYLYMCLTRAGCNKSSRYKNFSTTKSKYPTFCRKKVKNNYFTIFKLFKALNYQFIGGGGGCNAYFKIYFS